MKLASGADYGRINQIASACGLDPLGADVLDSSIAYIGEHGYFLLDMQDMTNTIAHVVILKSGRGAWAKKALTEFLDLVFTSTRIDRINIAVPSAYRQVRRFAADGGFRLVHKTDAYAFMDMDIMRWMCVSDACLANGSSASSDFVLADQEMVKRVTGACAMMHESGMEHKAWYIYKLYAKLFGYRVED